MTYQLRHIIYPSFNFQAHDLKFIFTFLVEWLSFIVLWSFHKLEHYTPS